MLKIGKKVQIKSQQTESRYTLEYETEEKLLKVVREKSQLGWKDVEEHIASLPSMSAAVIAEILQKIVANVQEDSLGASLAFIFKLIAIPHDARELRHFLKHKFRVEAELLLYLLWEKRDETLALYIVDVLLDTYTAQLILGDKHVLKLWKRHISNRAAFLNSKQRVKAALDETGEEETIKGGQGFRRLVIPL